MASLQREQTSPEMVSETSQHDPSKQRRGIAWVGGSFLLCPCHLPLTLGLLVALLSGTALGTFVLHYSILLGVILTLLWVAGTWYGFHQVRARTTCAIPSRVS